MGNCQATDAATMVIQHPSGKIERFYWPMSACEIMKMNPGHYVALLISTTLYHSQSSNNDHSHGVPYKTSNNANVTPVRLTRIKLLRSTDTLILGHVYRLVTTQEVMKGLSAKKHAKMNKNHQESVQEKAGGGQRSEHIVQVSSKHERQRPRSTTSSNSAAGRSKTWQPKLQSITEATTN